MRTCLLVPRNVVMGDGGLISCEGLGYGEREDTPLMCHMEGGGVLDDWLKWLRAVTLTASLGDPRTQNRTRGEGLPYTPHRGEEIKCVFVCTESYWL